MAPTVPISMREPVSHRPVEMIRHLRDLPGRDQRAHRHKAAVARLEAGSEPQVTEQKVGRVLQDPWSNRAKEQPGGLVETWGSA
jgi:hypothetical protein